MAFLPVVVPSYGASWKVQLNYDKDASTLELHDLECPSAKVCFASGAITDTSSSKDKVKGTIVSTSDGGAHWSFEELHDLPVSLFFLNESTGWMVTEKGIWQTLAGGHDWKKLANPKGVQKVWFLSESHGFAVATAKTIYETNDGGKSWTKIAASDLPASAPAATSYDSIFFSGSVGLISGTVAPEYITPGKTPLSAVVLITIDGGKTWDSKSINLQGRISSICMLKPPNEALVVVEYFGKAKYPAELFSLNLKTLESKAVFRQTDRVARDAVVLPDGQVLVAAVERLGELSEVPIPSKLRIMESTSLETWLPESVDYRAVAMRPNLAMADAHNVWIATDTGMILKRTE